MSLVRPVDRSFLFASRVAITVLALAFGNLLHAQLPETRLASVFPSGGIPGSTVEITVAGDNLDDVDALHFSHSGITAKQKMAEPGPFDKGPQPAPNEFVVTVAANVPLGMYAVRAVGKYGVSNPRAFTVGDMPQTRESEPNNSTETATLVELPVIINGRSDRAADVDYFKLTAGAGQHILVACQTRRIDSRMDAVITVYDASGRELGSSRDSHGRDPLVDFTAQTGGEYFVKVCDAVYQGNSDYFYQLSIGALPHIDFIFPPAGAAGGNRPFTAYGRNLPGGQPAGLTVDGHPLQKLAVSIPVPGGAEAQNVSYDSPVAPAGGGLDATQYRVKGPRGYSPPFPVGVASAPPILENEPNNSPDTAQKVTVPCELMGQFYPLRDRDWIQLNAKTGETFTIEVISQRAGMATDPNLMIQQVVKPAEGDQPEQVKQLAVVHESGDQHGGPEFDTRSVDPVYRLTAPADGTYRILARDNYNAIRADPRHVYRLAILKDQPDFRLVAVPEGSYSAVLLRKGGQTAIRVVAFRRGGFDGEIKITATGLPAGVTSSDGIIGPSRNAAALVLTTAANAAAATGSIQVVGSAQIESATVTRTARFGTALHPTAPVRGNQPQPPTAARLARNLIVSVSDKETAPAAIQAGGGKVWEVSRAGSVKIPYTRSGSFKGKINLVPRDLPANIDARPFSINPNANSGQYEIKLKANTPTGTYTFYLSGIAEKVSYARNPEAAKAAAERKQEVGKIAADAAARSKAAASAKAAADKLAAQTATAAKTALAAKNTAAQELAAANSATMAAADKAARAKTAAAQKPDDAKLAAAAKAAQKASDEATAKAKAAADKVAAAEKTLEDGNTKAKAAEEAKVEADRKAAEAAALAKTAAELKAKTDKRATDTANAAKPKPINVPVISTPISLKITPAPITLPATQPAGPLTQGEKSEIPVTITRLYGFKDQVTVTAVLPPGVSGLSIPTARIPAGQTQTKLAVTAAANATVGTHELTVRATLRLNNQNLTVDQPVALNIQQAQPPSGK